MRAAIYCRVSSQEQAEHGLSIMAQKKALYEYAAKNNMEIVAEYIDEGESAFKKRDNRPQFQKMIQDAKRKPRSPFDVILVHKWDRFARNREDSIVYKKLLRKDCKVELISITEPIEEGPVGLLMEGILELLAEFYSANLSQEVIKGMSEAARQGKPLGKPPLGYTIKNGRYEINPDEAKIVKYIFDTYATGEIGIHRLSGKLYTEGAKMFGECALKYKFPCAVISRILKKRVYIGEFNWNGITFSVPPIVPVDTFNKVQRLLSQRKVYRSPNEDYLLRGMVKCADCGSNMSLKKYKKNRNGRIKIYKTLQCTRYTQFGCKVCYYNHISLQEMEDHLFAVLRNAAKGKFALNINVTFSGSQSTRMEYDRITKELNSIPDRLQRLIIAYENRAIDLETLKLSRERLLQEKEEKERMLKALNEKMENENDIYQRQDYIKESIQNILTIVDNENLSIATRRDALKQIVDSITYSKRYDHCDINLRL